MAADEMATLTQLDAGRACFRKHAGAYGGRVVDTAGDSVLAIFETASGAVNAALAVQQEQPSGEHTPMRFRIGVHLGDIIEKADGTVYGDGVNIAARLQSLADAGGVMVSDVVYGAVRDRIAAAFEDCGEHTVKNIARPVRTFRVPASAVHGRKAEPTTGKRKRSIAILPFNNMSGDPEQEYFADGITEDIITLLSKHRWLFVVARNSTFAYKGSSIDVRRAAQDLNADYVVEGSVRKAGNRVRVTAQLLDGATGAHIWAERYDRELEDIFAVQDELTGAISARIEPELGEIERQRVQRKPTDNLDAWDCYHLGLSHMYRFDRHGNLEAQRLFRRAIDFDSGFAEAHARLAYCAVLQMVYFDSLPTSESLDEALAIARRAASLDERDAFAHLAVARVHLARREYDDALAECRASIELNPTLAQAYCAMGDALSYAGKIEQAIAYFDKAVKLSPQDPWRWAFYSYQALAYIFLGQYERAVDISRSALRVPNCQYWANAHLTAALGHLNRLAEARAALEELMTRKPGFTVGYAKDHLFYIEDARQLDGYLDGLRKAGVPD
jgi:adenylate cyclase